MSFEQRRTATRDDAAGTDRSTLEARPRFYIYLGKGRRGDQGDPDEVVLVYDRLVNHGGGDAISLLFADGHVEIVGGKQNTQAFVGRLETGHNPPRPFDLGAENKR